VTGGEVRQQRKVQRRFFVLRRDAHQTDHVETLHAATFFDERRCLLWGDAGLLRLFARVDLNETCHVAFGPAAGLGNGAGQFRAIDGFDHVEQGDSIAHLVGLQRADQVEPAIEMGGLKGGPFSLGFLDAVFTEDEVPGVDRPRDAAGVMGF